MTERTLVSPRAERLGVTNRRDFHDVIKQPPLPVLDLDFEHLTCDLHLPKPAISLGPLLRPHQVAQWAGIRVM